MRVVELALLAVVVASGVAGRYHARHHDSGAREGGARAAVNQAEFGAQHWYDEAYAGIRRREARGTHRMEGGSGPVAKNVILFLGDGMSFPTLMAARTLLGQRQGRTGEEENLSFEEFPTAGVSKTYCVDAQIADSACTATACLCGIKNNEATLGVTAAVRRRDCLASTDQATHVESIAEWALAAGKDAGLVTTTRVTHATPAGVYAKTASRYWENDAEVKRNGYDTDVCPDIAIQLVHHYPGTHLKVILGGGRREFLPNTTTDEEGSRGYRTDGRNLIQEWHDDKIARGLEHRYVWNKEALLAEATSPPEYLLGLFESSHMNYHLEANPSTEPTLAELTEVAIKSLSRNDKGFFLFVEGGRIDHAHHDSTVEKALDETIELAKAVQRATELVSEEDTLIVVTADHSHVLAINGYTRRGDNILGESYWHLDNNGVPFMTLSYTNGPGARSHVNGVRPDVTKDENFGDMNWLSHAEIPLENETHGGDDVGVFAWGPLHVMFSGLYEQSQIPHLMAYASCIGPGPRAPACNAAATHHTIPLALLLAVAAYLSLLR